MVVGGKTPPLASHSVEVGRKATPLKATPLKATPLAYITTATGVCVTGGGDVATPARGSVAADHYFLIPVTTATHTVAAPSSTLQQ